MAKGKKISEVSLADALSGDELIPFAKNGANGAVEADTIKEFAQDGLDDKYADKSDTYTKSEVDGLVDGATSTAETTYAKKEDVPTKVSELENDAKFQTESEVDGKLTDKVDKEDGKGLSSNDFTDEDKAKLDSFELVLANDDEIEDGLHQIASSEDYRSKLKENGYVVYHDVKYKVKDCGVTSDSYPWIITEGAVITANADGTLNDHTQENIVRSVYIWFDTILHYQPYNTSIPSKVSELTNDLKYTTETQVENRLKILYESLDSQLVDEYTHLDNKKVDKVTGKQLSTEDFTTLLKQKLEGLTNYDDSTLTSELNALKSRLDTLVGSGDVTAVIDTFQEIEAFLQGVTNTQTLTGLLQEMKGEIVALVAKNYVQSKISYQDIDTIIKDGHYRTGENPGIINGYNYKHGQLLVVNGGNTDVNLTQIVLGRYNANNSIIPPSYRAGVYDKDTDTYKWENWKTLALANGTSSQFLKADGSVDGTAYLPMSGGTISGTTEVPLIINTTNTINSVTRYQMNGGNKAYCGYNTNSGAVLHNYTCAKSLGIKDDGTLHFNNYQLWHAGNDGAGSGLDADLLDGKQPADLNVGSADKLNPKQLTDEDLNTIRDVKFNSYYGASGHTCENTPTGNNKPFCLQTYGWTTSYCFQIYTDISSNTIYKRRLYETTWSAWKKILTDGDVNAGTIPADSLIDVIDTEDADFIIADEDENPLVIFADGHIRTANFDSANISATNKIEMSLPGKWCALGTSITAWDATNANGIKGYQYWVKKRISFGSYVNKGVNGYQMNSLAANLDLIVEADYYTLEFGTNDFQGNLSAGTIEDYVNSTGVNTFAGAMRIVIDKIYEVNPSALIILCTPRKFYYPGLGITSWTSTNSAGAKLIDFVNVIREIAQYESFPVADFFALSNTNSHNLVALSNEEALHPTTTGHQLMANVLVEQFKLLYQY